MDQQTIIVSYRRLLQIAVAVWTSLILIAAFFYWNDQYRQTIELAKNTAKTALNKDLATRTWVISHGGIYVPIDHETPPNPYLSHIKERDIQTPSGNHLTLMNSSYVLRQMMERYGTLYGEKTRITSLHPINPHNKATLWEEKALRFLQENPSETDFNEVTDTPNGAYLRMMIPMITDKSCLKCHNRAENAIGGLRGGIDISVPLQAFDPMMHTTLIHTYGWLLLIWFFGTATIILAFKTIEKKAIQLHTTELEKIQNYQNMIALVIDLIDKRDSYTSGHSQRVAYYCEIIARAMYHDESIVKKIKEAATMHDVGKIAIPDSILLKPGNLTPTEKELINYHLTAGYELLSKVDMYQELAEIMRHHHERYDGKGYPQGLSGEEIPPLSRIMIIADAFDAMTTNRIYKPRKSIHDALDEIKMLKGSQFDPEVADVAISVLRDITIEAYDQFPKTDIEEERFAYYLKDQLTGLNNHWALESILNVNQHSHEYRYATSITLMNLTIYNHQNGWKNGDILLEKFGSILKERFRDKHIYRIFGDTFVILSQEILDLSSDHLNTAECLDQTGITLYVSVIHLFDANIDSINTLEERIKSQIESQSPSLH